MGKKLIQNTGILFLSKVCTQLISFLLLPFYTAYLSTSEYGFSDLVFTYISLFAPMITFQLEMAVFRFLIDAKNVGKKQIISTVFSFLVFLSIALLLIGLPVFTIVEISYGEIIVCNIIVTIFSNMLLQIARGFGKTKHYAIGVFIISSVTILLNVIFLAIFKMGVIGLFLSMMIATIISSIYLCLSLNIKKYLDIRFVSKNQAKELLKYSLPLVPNGISWWVIHVSDRTMISSMLGTGQNGIYALANKFPTLFSNFTGVFHLAWTESASHMIDDPKKDHSFSAVINHTIQIFSYLCILGMTMMPFAFPFLVHDSFQEAYLYIPILFIASFFNSIVKLYSGIYIAKKLTKQVMNTSMIAAVLNIILNLLWIPTIGIYAACFSTLIAYFSMLLYRYFDMKKYIHIQYHKKTIGFSFFSLFIVTINYYMHYTLLNVIISVLIGGIIYDKNRAFFKQYLNLTKRKKTL